MAALLVGIGLARFAYAPLLPAVIAHGWFAPGAAAYLGAANLLGYLFGALGARRAAAGLGNRATLRGAMLVAAVSLAACCAPLPFAWFFGWRVVSGMAGGALMILAPSTVLAVVPAERRGLAGGLIVTGVGLGVAASGTLVPLLIRWGLPQAWLGLAALCLVLTAAVWRGWPAVPAPVAGGGGTTQRFGALCGSYGLCAVGVSPHMVFLVDYVARGLGRGLDAGALAWVLFGAGALCGPVTAGRLIDRIGAERTVWLVMAVEALIVLALLSAQPVAVALSALFGGAVCTGITAATLGRVGLRAGSDHAARQRGWTQTTVAWAVGQAAGTYGMAWLFNATGGYRAMFLAALAALAGAAVIEAALVRRPAAVAA